MLQERFLLRKAHLNKVLQDDQKPTEGHSEEWMGINFKGGKIPFIKKQVQPLWQNAEQKGVLESEAGEVGWDQIMQIK